MDGKIFSVLNFLFLCSKRLIKIYLIDISDIFQFFRLLQGKSPKYWKMDLNQLGMALFPP